MHQHLLLLFKSKYADILRVQRLLDYWEQNSGRFSQTTVSRASCEVL